MFTRWELRCGGWYFISNCFHLPLGPKVCICIWILACWNLSPGVVHDKFERGFITRWRHCMEMQRTIFTPCISCYWKVWSHLLFMMTSPNWNIFRVTDPLRGQRPVTQSFDAFFDLRLNKRLSKQSRRWWFETPSRSLWRHCNVLFNLGLPLILKTFNITATTITHRNFAFQH